MNAIHFDKDTIRLSKSNKNKLGLNIKANVALIGSNSSFAYTLYFNSMAKKYTYLLN